MLELKGVQFSPFFHKMLIIFHNPKSLCPKNALTTRKQEYIKKDSFSFKKVQLF